MNKKIILIASIVVIVLLAIFSIVMYFLSKKESPVINNPSQINMGTEATTTQSNIPVSKPVAVKPLSINENPSGTETRTIDESFPSQRMLFLNGDETGQKIINYFKTNQIGDNITVAVCNIATNQVCLANFQKISNACNLSSDTQSNVPLAYNVQDNTCYQGYDQIVNYLDEQVMANEEALRARNDN